MTFSISFTKDKKAISDPSISQQGISIQKDFLLLLRKNRETRRRLEEPSVPTMPLWLADLPRSFSSILYLYVLLSSSLHLAKSVPFNSLSDPDDSPVHRLSLSDGLELSWRLDYPAQLVNAEVSFDSSLLNERDSSEDRGKTLHGSGLKNQAYVFFVFFSPDWVAIGFSNNGSLTNADLCILWTDWKGETQLTVGYSRYFIK